MTVNQASTPRAASSPRTPARSLYATWLPLLAILVIGGYFRFFGLTTWDEPSYRLHPDERFMVDVASIIRIPETPGDYFDSYANTLNPRNNGKDFYVYGLFPQSLTRLTAVLLTPPDLLRREGQPDSIEARLPRPPILPALLNPEGKNLTDYNEVFKVGRAWSALFDTGALLVLFLIGRRLYSARVGLLAALLLGLAALPIQLAHFFTVDAATAFFVLWAIYWGVRITQGGGPAAFVMLGCSIGAAMACRITLATLGFVGMLAVAHNIVQAYLAERRRPMGRAGSIALHQFAWLMIAGGVTVLVFRTLSPDAFIGSQPSSPIVSGPIASVDARLHGAGFLDVRPDPRFLTNMTQIGKFASGEIDWPPTNQWASRPRFVFALQNMIVWGMGVPLGIAVWAGWAAAGWQLLRRRMVAHLIPWAWVTVFFGWQGGQLLMSMRYYALLYGLLALFAAWGLVWVWEKRGAGGRTLRLAATIIPLFVVVFTLAWAHAFTRIYSEPHTRIAASRWIYANIPPGSAISSEAWDDGLPLNLDGRSADEYVGVQMHPYAEDEPIKYYGRVNADGVFEEGLLDQLDRLDYLIYSSNRVYDSVTRLKMRYPAITNFYHHLFEGNLGFELVADIHSYPTLFGVPLNDQGAEEAFSVYDHPRVLIFKKTPEYTRERAEQLITGDVAWGEIYRIPTVLASRVPTALRLTAEQWPEFRAAGTWSERFSAQGIVNAAPWLFWLLVIELLGLAAFALLFHALPSLPDRGFALAKTLGLLLTAYCAWLFASLGGSDGAPLIPFGGASLWLFAGLLMAAGGAVAWRSRAALRAFGQAKRAALLSAEGVFLAFFCFFLILRAINPDLWHPARGGEKPMDLAFLTAVLKSPAFPPYDPWFAGGYLNYYYFGFVFAGAPALLTGIAPQIAYNLAVPTIAALTALGAWGAAYNMLALRPAGIAARARLLAALRGRAGAERRMGRERRAVAAGIAAALFVVLLGNLAQAVWHMPGTADMVDPGTPAECRAVASYAAQQECKGRAEWAFWDATRLVGMALRAGEINEFPFFTFLFADLHAHMIALPLALAGAGLMVAIARAGGGGRSRRAIPLVLLALVAGSLYATNTWDYPVTVGLGVLALALPPYVRWRRGGSLGSALVQWGGAAAALVLLSTLLFQPFRSSFATDYAGFELWNGDRTPAWAFLQVNGLWLFLAVSGALALYVRSGRIPARIAAAAGGFYLLLAAALVLLGWDALGLQATLVLGGMWMLLDLALRDAPTNGVDEVDHIQEEAQQLELPLDEPLRPIEPARPAAVAGVTLLAAIFGLGAIGITLLTEVIVAKGDIGRMNTVFKLGMQSWALFGVAGGVALAQLWRAPAAAGQAWWAWRGIAALLIAAALVYPITATPARLADRYDATIGPTLDGTAFLRSERSTWAENDTSFTFAEDAGMLEWMRANIDGTPIVLEAHAEAYRWSGRVAVYTGLPTLLGWPWHMTQQRSVTDAGPIIGNRQTLIANLYTALPLGETLRTLQRYGVEYVVVGRLEQALYGQVALARFEGLAQAGEIETVYNAEGTRVYRVPVNGNAPAVLTTATVVQAPPDMPPAVAMLPVRVGDLPAAHVPGWNEIAANEWAAVVIWLLCWYALLLLGLPAAALAFGERWPDGGFAWARILGLLLTGYAIWLPVSGRWWSYDNTGIALGLLAVLGLNGLLLAWLGRRAGTAGGIGAQIGAGVEALVTLYSARRRRLLAIEGIFLGAFGFMLALRALNPDLWQPIWGGEKPFEFGFLNALARTSVLPPYSPFFSDGTINYYYYGFFLVSLPLRVGGIAPAIAYNLVVPTLFALLLSGVVALLLRVGGRWWAALAGAAFVGVFGNLAAAFGVGWSRGLDVVAPALEGGLGEFGRRLGDWFIGPTRVIPGADPRTINEFPYFSFLFADLHPHVIAMPITVLMIAIAYALFADRRRDRPEALTLWGAALLTLGALAVTNSWDFPTYGLLFGGALLGAAWRAPAASGWRRLANVVAAGSGAAVAGAGALLLYLPFFQNYTAMVSGVGLVRQGTLLIEYLLLYGLFIAVLAPALGMLALRLIRLSDRAAQRRAVTAVGIVAGAPEPPAVVAGLRAVLVVAMVLVVAIAIIQPALGLAAGGAGAPPFDGALGLVQAVLGLRLWLAALIIVGAAGLLVRRLAPATWFTIWMTVVGLIVSLLFELIYVRDHLDGGEWYRMNTVFKFGLQAWVLLAIAAAAALPWMARGARRMGAAATAVGGAILTLLVGISLIYPIVGTPSRVALRFPDTQGPTTLDGLAFMQTARYSAPGYITPEGALPATIELRHDYAAIQWLNANVRQTDVVLQSSLEFYRAYGVRIAANTGLPTIVSPLHESEQRDGGVVGERDRDVITIYRTTDPQEALRLLAKYRVAYLVVGPIEQIAYGPAGIAKFEMLVGSYLDPVYRNEQVTIYRTLPTLNAIAPLPRVNAAAPATAPRAPIGAEPGAVDAIPLPDVAPAPAPDAPAPDTPPTADASLAEVERIVAADPSAAGPAFELAQRYRALGREADAAAVLEPAARANPGDIGLNHLWGDILLDLGRYDEATYAFAQAVAAEPSAGNYNKLAQGYEAGGKLPEAEAAYRQAIAADADAPDPYYHLAALYEKLGRSGDATAQYRRYLEIAPPDGQFRAAATEALARLGN
jgi:YYY domain-containing protein